MKKGKKESKKRCKRGKIEVEKEFRIYATFEPVAEPISYVDKLLI